MAFVLQAVSDIINFLSDNRDPRTKDWLFVHPTHFLIIEMSYLIFVLGFGPWFMKNRPPYNLRYVIRAYNVFQIVLNAYLCYVSYIVLFVNNFNFRCEAMDFTNSQKAFMSMTGIWLYYITKIIDMLDTVFITLKKKEKQLSFLHIYHHSFLVFVCFLIMNYQPGGNTLLTGCLNSAVHLLMYTYYLITSLGPEYKHYVWWKKYLTQLQIAQFVVCGVHMFQSLFRDCGNSKFLGIAEVVNEVLFMYLFGMFYVRTYLRPKTTRRKD